MARAFRSISILISSISLILIFGRPALAQDGSGSNPISQRRSVVQSVDLAGAVSFEQSNIKKLLYTKPNRWYNLFKKRELSKSNIKLDEGIIKRYYGRRGFLFTEVKSIIGRAPGNRAAVIFSIAEGKRVNLNSVKLSGGIDQINKRFNRVLDLFEPGAPIDAEKVISDGYKLRDLYFDHGYPYAKIYSRYEFNADSGFADVTYSISESVFTVYGDVKVPEQLYTRPYVIKRDLLIDSEKPYSQKNITDSEQRLYSLGLFKLVNIRRDDSLAAITNDTCRVDFSMSVRERKSYFLGFGFGLGREEGVALVQRNSIQWGNRNIFGTARKIVVAVKPRFKITHSNGDFSGSNLSDLTKDLQFSLIRSTIELDYITPWMFHWRIPVTARVYYEPYTLNTVVDPPYRYDRMAGEVIFSKEVDRFTTARITTNTEYINIRDVPKDQEEVYRQKGDNQIRRKLLLYGEHDTRDNILAPQSGSYSYGGVEYVGRELGGDFSYFKTQFMWSRFNRISGQTILASRIWLGFLDDRFKSGRSTSDDRFIIGGSSTIRGFRENSLGPMIPSGEFAGDPDGGRYMMIGNIEIRQSLFWRFGGTAFLDAGNTYARRNDITALSVQFVPGLGMQFFTPIGPIRFDYAVRLQKEFDLGAGLYHFAILYAF